MATPRSSRNTRSRSRLSEAEANNGSNNPTPTSVRNTRQRGVHRGLSSPLSPENESAERITSAPSTNANSGSRSLSGRYARGPTDSPGTNGALRTRRRRPEGVSRARRQMFTDADEQPGHREQNERADDAQELARDVQGSQNEIVEAPNPTPSPNVISSQNPVGQRASATPRRTPVSSPFSGLSPYRPSPHSRGEIRSGSSGRRVLQRISSTPVRAQSRGGPITTNTPRSDVNVATPDPSITTPRGTPSISISDAPSEPIQTFVWGTNVNIEDCSARFRRFLENFEEDDSSLRTPRNDDIGAPAMYMRKIKEVVEKEFISLNIDCANLKKFDAELYNVLIHYPEEVIPLSDLVATELATSVAKSMYGLRTPGTTPTTPNDDPLNGRRLQVRPFNLAKVKSLRDLDPIDIDQMVCVRGMVTRSSMVTPDLKQAYYECSICGASEVTFIDNGIVVEPQQCNNPGNPHKNTMHLVHNRCTFTDKQIVRMQETPDGMPEGQTPHTVTLFVYDELVDVMKPGDRVEITAIFRASADRENPRTRTLRSLYHTYLDVLHVRKAEGNRFVTEQFSSEKCSQRQEDTTTFFESDRTEQELEEEEITLRQLGRRPGIYEQLVDSLAPSIFGLEDVKKGLLCQLFGGSNKRIKTATPGTADPLSQAESENETITTRGDINILMCGDPGTSKSQLLSYVHKIAPRGIYTSGRGSSAVGLTAYVTKDPETRENILESGALVLSDRGICCIDEFDKMGEAARSTLHEVMEQQTVSVAKAGIICQLNARTSVLAAANPRESRYNPRISIIENLQLPPSLLSRFDLIYLLLDRPDEASDRKLARHLVALHFETPDTPKTPVSIQQLTKYISYARRTIHPRLSDEAVQALTEEYVTMRKSGSSRKVITATPRQLESLIRMSESLARMRLSEAVEVVDVEEAVRLMKVAMQQAATDPRTGTIDLDLIQTGMSTSARKQREMIVEAIKEILEDLPVHSSSTMTVDRITAKLRERVSATQRNEVLDALRLMADEQYLELIAKETSVRKL